MVNKLQSLANIKTVTFEDFEKDIVAFTGKGVVVGIDGESFSGKTTASRYISSTYKGWKKISLDTCISNPQVRRDAFGDSNKAKRLFDYWYDKNKLSGLIFDPGQNYIVEGTFLLAAFPKNFFHRIYIMKVEGIGDLRVRELLARNKLLSKEEALALESVYKEAWNSYETAFHVDASVMYVERQHKEKSDIIK